MRLVAGRDAVAEVLARGNVAESYREDAAGQGTDAEVFLAGGAVAELLLAGAPWRSYWYGQPAEAAGRGAVGELLVRAASGSCWPGRRSGATGTGSQRKQLAGALRRDGAKRQSVRKSLPLGERRRCGKGKVQSSLGMVQSIIGKVLNGSNQHFTPFLFQCHRPHIAIPIITKYNSAA